MKTNKRRNHGADFIEDRRAADSYHITDKKTLTVGERDYCISNMMSDIQDYWNGTDIEEMLRMEEDDIVSRLKEIAAEYSNDNITITIHEDSVSFERMIE